MYRRPEDAENPAPHVPADPSHDLFDAQMVTRLLRVVDLMAPWFRPDFHGMEHIPRQGPALLIGNHGIYGLDSIFIFNGVYKGTGRFVRGLADNMLFVDPLSRWFWPRVGGIHGTPENALAYLRAGHLVNAYPGGARDALKTRDRRYTLHWEKSRGFIRVALRAGVPIVLHMGIGTDDIYHILGRVPLLGSLVARTVGHEKYDVPLLLGWGPLPRPVKFDYYISPPIHLEACPEDADDPDVVDRLHEQVWRQANHMLQEGLRRRRSVYLG